MSGPGFVRSNASDWEKLAKKLESLSRTEARKIVRTAMRQACKPMLQASKAEARSMASKGERGRGRPARPLMEVVADRLKLRALKRSRRRQGFQILIAATSADIERARSVGPIDVRKRPWYAPGHAHWGHQIRGARRVVAGRRMGRRVQQNPWLTRLHRRSSGRWFQEAGSLAVKAVEEELKKP